MDSASPLRAALAAFVLVLLLPLAALAAPMTNDDVIKLVRAGLGEATVLQAIDAAEPAFDTSPDGLVKLKQGGASDTVIQRILGRASGAPAPAPAKPAAAAPACADCGTVTELREIDKPGQATGVGAVGGAVVGGLLGRSLGGSNNRTLGTVVGAAGGAVAGHMIEKKAREGKTWEIGVRFDDGTVRTYRQDSQPSLQNGDRVRVNNGIVVRM